MENQNSLYERAMRRIILGEGNWKDVGKFVLYPIRAAIDLSYTLSNAWEDVGAPHLKSNVEDIVCQGTKATLVAGFLMNYLS